MSESEYYIPSHKRGYWSGNLVFWGPSRSGYYSSIDSAGRYSKEEADEITKFCGGKDSVALECETVERVARRVIPAEYAKELGALRPTPPKQPKETFRCCVCGQFTKEFNNPEAMCEPCNDKTWTEYFEREKGKARK